MTDCCVYIKLITRDMCAADATLVVHTFATDINNHVDFSHMV